MNMSAEEAGMIAADSCGLKGSHSRGGSGHRSLLRLSGVTMAALAALILLPAYSLRATTYTVTTTEDNATTPPAGSLREAIITANTGGGTNTINFSPGLSGTITLASELPAIQDNGLTIDGSGATITISGGNTYRCFFIGTFSGSTQVAVNVTIENLTFSGCEAQGGTGGAGYYGGGGGAGLGGAIFVANQATVTLSNVSFSSNNATGGAGGATSSSSGFGGGGGMGGNGGSSSAYGLGGGGGLGVAATGGSDTSTTVNGLNGTVALGAAAGGAGYDCGEPWGTGGANGGGGGGVAVPSGASVTCGGGGGGVGGQSGGSNGGSGGFGGGGGAGMDATGTYGYGGAGGFGGG
ncbi:MAG: hypothetical protein M1404_01960, partial [Acidobacteria bacterium]|nr:hypothetical protein [Acidobacteriota bacterium]